MSVSAKWSCVTMVSVVVAGAVACAADRGGFPDRVGDASTVESGDDGGSTSSSGGATSSGGTSTSGSTGGGSSSSGGSPSSGSGTASSSSSSGGSGTASSSSSSSGGSGSTSSSSGSGGDSDAGPCPACALKVQLKQENGTSTTTTNAHLDFNIVNMGSAAQDMDEITLEFFYTSQGVLTAPTVDCYQVSLGTCPSPVTTSSAALSAFFRSYSPATATADSYMLLAFPGVTIPAGESLLVRVGLHNTTSTGNFDLTEDYSFTAADTSFADAPTIPLYYNGLLLWGEEP